MQDTKMYFKSLEKLEDNQSIKMQDIIENLAFDRRGLIPVIAQDFESKAVLMFAWMNLEALQKTISTGQMTYWSRSRKSLWHKGETSGHTQTVISMSFDCDGDAILCQVKQLGSACHTMRKSCFYLHLNEKQNTVYINDNYSV